MVSKLRDRIRRLGRREAGPMGFAPAVAAKQPGMLLILRLPAKGAVEPALEGGADAVLVDAGGRSVTKQPPDLLLGLDVRGAADDVNLEGADFIVADGAAPSAVLANEGRGLVLAVDEAWPDALLRASETLAPDALFVELGAQPTLQRILELRRVALVGGAPLLLGIAGSIDPPILRVLRDAGVVGLVVDSKGASAMPQLRETINSMPPRRRPNEADSPLLPHVEVAHEHEDEMD
ncbi:MAG TPA: hypothetical protein VNL92_07725 [Dehalococcoidia bacterium]|nr:hypothetical protein [Dehalococcoidia bacterium]